MKGWGFHTPALCALLLAAAATTWANPPTAVSEDFAGAQFPPAGWTTEGSGQGNWSWSNPGGYARGYCCPVQYEYLNTILKSPYFNVNAGTSLHVRFRYYTVYGGEGAQMHVYIGPWYVYLPYAAAWTWMEEDTTVYGAPTSLRAEWRIYGNGGSHGNTAYLYIDDVSITRNNAAVEPASLGRVKTMHK
jgi:hypothetical protein